MSRVRAISILVAVLLLPGCPSEKSSESPGPPSAAVPFRKESVSAPVVISPDSPLRSLTARIVDYPPSVRAGQTMEFAVELRNPTSMLIELQPCPSYAMSFGESSEATRFLMLRLNCADVRAIAAGKSVRFAMEIDLPLTFELGSGSIYWRLESVVDVSSEEIGICG